MIVKTFIAFIILSFLNYLLGGSLFSYKIHKWKTDMWVTFIFTEVLVFLAAVLIAIALTPK